VGFVFLIVLTFVVMWLVFLRPQRRRIQQQRAMIESLAPGQEVLTAGGVYGDVTEVGEDEVAIEIAPGVVVRVAMRAVAAVIPPDVYEEDGEAEEIEGEDEEQAAELGPAPSGGIDAPEAPVERERR
jgi:preprotein translocase subunit YajC